MKHMATVGIRELKQNASKVVARAAAGEVVTVTDRGRAVARLVPIAHGRLEELRSSGLLRLPTRSVAELGPPPEPSGDGRSLTELLFAMRDEERC
jgi:prevent-host-death family protein